MPEPIFFESWFGLWRILIVGVLGYAAMVALVRFSGKRTLGKMNAFDLIVSIAMGSVLATLIVNKSVPLLEGILAFSLLVGLQFVITWLSVRSDRFRGLVKSEPTLLVHQSRYLDAAMRKQRVTRGEIASALRENGNTDISEVESVVLETDGNISVVVNADAATRQASIAEPGGNSV